jgi:hypothetical protein
MKPEENKEPETSSFHTDPSMQNYDDNYDPSEFKYINQDLQSMRVLRPLAIY